MPSIIILILLSALHLAWAVPAQKRAVNPTVVISKPEATVGGSMGPNNIDTFNRIFFALPPAGPLRLKPPQPIKTSQGNIQATSVAKSYPQFLLSTDEKDVPSSVISKLFNIPMFQEIINSGEDCLTLDVRRPSKIKADAKLPVVVWIFGGGFEQGATTRYDGSNFVTRSVELDMPVVFVTMNHRLGGFGFLPGTEILKDGAANLGVVDHRFALQWVAENIAASGGDPSKVDFWYHHELRQHCACKFSRRHKRQTIYDTVVKSAGCSGVSDTLACLCELDYTKFLNAANSVPGIMGYNSVAESYLPRPDGTVLTASPEQLVIQGKYASVPFIIGGQEDEGTIFAIYQNNVTTTEHIVDYLQSLYVFDPSRQQTTDFVATYRNIQEDGSPFRTGSLYNWYPQYKRLAAILGDLSFTLIRRAFLDYAQKAKPDVPS